MAATILEMCEQQGVLGLRCMQVDDNEDVCDWTWQQQSCIVFLWKQCLRGGDVALICGILHPNEKSHRSL
jgi:hypothetical protein